MPPRTVPFYYSLEQRSPKDRPDAVRSPQSRPRRDNNHVALLTQGSFDLNDREMEMDDALLLKRLHIDDLYTGKQKRRVASLNEDITLPSLLL